MKEEKEKHSEVQKLISMTAYCFNTITQNEKDISTFSNLRVWMLRHVAIKSYQYLDFCADLHPCILICVYLPWKVLKSHSSQSLMTSMYFIWKEIYNAQEYDRERDHFGNGDNRCEGDEVKLQSYIPYTPCNISGMDIYRIVTHSLDNGREEKYTLSSYSQSISKDEFTTGPWCENNTFREFSSPQYSFCSRDHQQLGGRWISKDRMHRPLHTFSPSPLQSHSVFPLSLCEEDINVHEVSLV